MAKKITIKNYLNSNAIKLRKNATIAENKLWQHLRNNRFCNYKFRRQKIIGSYIVDFVCLQIKLIVEIDGSQHLEQENYDNIRTRYFENNGYTVIRFWNNKVLGEIEFVLDSIYNACIKLSYNLPSPGASRHPCIFILTASN